MAQIYVPNGWMDKESPEEARKFAGWLDERYAAIANLRQLDYDLARISNFGRQMLNQHGPTYKRILSLSHLEFDNLQRETHGTFIHDEKAQLSYAKKHRAVSFLPERR